MPLFSCQTCQNEMVFDNLIRTCSNSTQPEYIKCMSLPLGLVSYSPLFGVCCPSPFCCQVPSRRFERSSCCMFHHVCIELPYFFLKCGGVGWIETNWKLFFTCITPMSRWFFSCHVHIFWCLVLHSYCDLFTFLMSDCRTVFGTCTHLLTSLWIFSCIVHIFPQTAMSISCGAHGTSGKFESKTPSGVTGARHRTLFHPRGNRGTVWALVKRWQAWVEIRGRFGSGLWWQA